MRFNDKTKQTPKTLASAAIEVDQLAKRIVACAAVMAQHGIDSVEATHDASRRIGLEKLTRFVEALERGTQASVLEQMSADPQAFLLAAIPSKAAQPVPVATVRELVEKGYPMPVKLNVEAKKPTTKPEKPSSRRK